MTSSIYRRKPLIVTAKPSVSGWLVDEGGQETYYHEEAFKELFDKIDIDLQAEITVGPNADMFGFDYGWCDSLEGRALINELLGIEAISADNQTDGQSWMFKPYPISVFGRMLKSVVDDMHWTWGGEQNLKDDPPLFTEVGCGIGAKLALAQRMFGLSVRGFDYNRDYCESASQLLRGMNCERWNVQQFDARSEVAVAFYETSDIIYLNRPFVHLELQGELESIVLKSMRPHAYIILANFAADVNTLLGNGWRKIDEDKVAIVLQKPCL